MPAASPDDGFPFSIEQERHFVPSAGGAHTPQRRPHRMPAALKGCQLPGGPPTSPRDSAA